MSQSICPICNTFTENKFINKYHGGKSNVFKGRNIVQCRSCKLVFTDPMPSETQLRNYYYNSEYLEDSEIRRISKDMPKVYEVQAKERVRYLSRHIPIKKIERLLDIGTGDGLLFDMLKELGYSNIDFIATEWSDLYLETLKKKGITVYRDIEEIPETSVDLITLCYILEHVPKPVDFLNLVIKRLTKGGYLFIDVPVRDDQYKLIPECHLIFFSEESMRRLIEKVDLEILHITEYGNELSHLIHSNRLKNKLLGVMPRHFRIMVKRIYGILRAPFNRSGDDKVSDIYNIYKLNIEGDRRQWLRCILYKK